MKKKIFVIPCEQRSHALARVVDMKGDKVLVQYEQVFMLRSGECFGREWIKRSDIRTK